MTEDSPARVVGFVGLGAMGAHMVARLLDAGHDVAFFDTREGAMAPHVDRGARACASVGAVADVATTVLVSLPTPDVVRAVAGELAQGEAIEAFVDLSTTGPEVAAEVAAALGAAGVACLDAPVSGGVAGAQAGTLTIMAAGDEALFQSLRPLLEALGRNVVLVGAQPGQGQLAKVLNNLLSASAIAITGEALALGVHGGLSARTLLDVFNSSRGRNTASADKFPRQVLPPARAAADLRCVLATRAHAQGRRAVPGRGAPPGGAHGARRRGGPAVGPGG